MTDIMSPAERSARMALIHGKNTTPELAVRRALHHLGYRYRLHARDLPGKPDVAFPSRSKAIFVHGCFWHQHPDCPIAHLPSSRQEYWAEKFKRTAERDEQNLLGIRALGWEVKGVELLDYNRELVRLLNERSNEFEASLAALRVLAENSDDSSFLRELEAASKRFKELQRAETSAREIADRERVARRQAERQTTDAVQRFEEERKRNLFLTSITTLDKETIEILHHQIIIHASAVNEIINGQFDALRRGTVQAPEALLTVFENIAFQNKKVLSIARFATKANFRLDSEAIQEDLAAYITQYIDRVAPIFAETGIRISVESSAKGLVRTFKPIEVSILIDNLVSNAGKADADEIKFLIEETTRQQAVCVSRGGAKSF
jgi:DNA mismatch endonuclease Vsr